ncbi:TPR Domain containing protein [Histomonas meleagridis]|uniref:TPR Domain containing protein n=1 Tax=Histomonas meleagridis TaxID=135588 RepID=UPI00355AA6F7|nr:TPR Domain containing protein [Histomonas meleagridis]KAH0804038.1 TPR Domain containing protein [Histomonas meleagridis]
MIVGSNKKRTNTPTKEKLEPAPPKNEANEQFILQSIESRDYSGAATFIEFLRDELNQPYTKEMALWHGYSLFHLGDYAGAINVYKKLLQEEPENTNLYLCISSCLYYNHEFEEAKKAVEKGPEGDYRTRLEFHIAQQLNDEQLLFKAHSKLVGTMENQLSLAAINYMRSNYSDAIEIYQRILLQNPDFIALHVYIAMCQFKLDQFQESNESVDEYLSVNSDSAIGLNLKACGYLRLFEPEIAESQILQIRKFSSSSYTFINSLINHNLVVFHDGEDAFSVLPSLVDTLPEARYNLAVMYMRTNNCVEAYNLVEHMQPVEISESILKANVLLAYGQLNSDANLIDEANGIYAEIGNTEGVCDTVPGRECLISSHFITSEYQETLKILQTIEQYVNETDEFNYNKAMTYAILSRWKEAEKYFLLVKNQQYTKEIFYTSWLCRCYIKNDKPDEAWKLYVDATQTEDAKTLLQIIANDCFNSGYYFYAMKAYDVLAKFEGDNLMTEGMIASAIGLFKDVLAHKETPDKLSEVLSVLESEPDAAEALEIIQNYIEKSDEFDLEM